MVLDLAVDPSLRDAALAEAQAAGVPVVAFGSHVDRQGLHAARAGGAAEVLTRGQVGTRLAQAVARNALRTPGKRDGSAQPGGSGEIGAVGGGGHDLAPDRAGGV